MIRRLESRLTVEISRVELETQNANKTIAVELNKWKKDRETCWKHVGELKDQNRHLRQRNYELEIQNGHLNRHIMLLQEQLTLMKDTAQQLQALKGVVIGGSNTAAILHTIPKVPHSGTDIW